MTSFNIQKQGSGAGYPSDFELKPFLDDCECSEWAAAIESKWPHLKVNSGYYQDRY